MLTRLLPTLHVLGGMLMFFSIAYLMPIAASCIFGDGTWGKFLFAMGIAFVCGALLFLAGWRRRRELKPRDGFLLVTLSWILMPAIATVPLLLVIDNLSFTDAFFETMSGLSTTGATVLSGLDKLPPAVNIWRHELNWLGGMGIIVLAVAILPLLGVGGMQLYKAETTGINKESKLTARIGDTAKALWAVYFVITMACIVSLKAAGMNWFDAVCHAFAAMGLGGFSTYDDSVGHFDSPLIEAVLIFFMIVAALNFATHFLVWKKRSLRLYWQDAEVKGVLGLIVSSTLICALYLQAHGTYPDFITSLRHVAFNLVSIATDCGFASQDFDKWPLFVPLWMLFLSCVTASSGSTGGGIKMVRTLILAQQGLVELKRLVHPHVVTTLRVGNTPVSPSIAGAVLGFIFLYILTIGELTFLLVASGLDFTSSLSAIVACINNAGPGLNVVGPAQNYQALTDFQVWVCSAAMLIGRLEVMTAFVLFTPAFWRS